MAGDTLGGFFLALLYALVLRDLGSSHLRFLELQCPDFRFFKNYHGFSGSPMILKFSLPLTYFTPQFMRLDILHFILFFPFNLLILF